MIEIQIWLQGSCVFTRLYHTYSTSRAITTQNIFKGYSNCQGVAHAEYMQSETVSKSRVCISSPQTPCVSLWPHSTSAVELRSQVMGGQESLPLQHPCSSEGTLPIPRCRIYWSSQTETGGGVLGKRQAAVKVTIKESWKLTHTFSLPIAL